MPPHLDWDLFLGPAPERPYKGSLARGPSRLQLAAHSAEGRRSTTRSSAAGGGILAPER